VCLIYYDIWHLGVIVVIFVIRAMGSKTKPPQLDEGTDGELCEAAMALSQNSEVNQTAEALEKLSAEETRQEGNTACPPFSPGL